MKGGGNCGSNQIVSQQIGPHFAVHHLRGFTPNRSQVDGHLNAASIPLRISPESIQFSDLFLGELIRVNQRGDDRQLLCATAFLHYVVAKFTQFQSLGNLIIRSLIHPPRS